MLKLIVWTTLRASPEQVWDVVTDPSELAGALPWWVRWDLSDPEGLRRALRDGVIGRQTFATRLRLFGRRADMPVRVVDALPPLRWKLQADFAWLSPCEHRVRLERALNGRLRLVQEVVAAPAPGVPGRVIIEVVRRALVGAHQRLAAGLNGEPGAIGRSRVYVLTAGNASHSEDPLGRLGDG